MGDLRFEWDPKKARATLAKHGVSFEEAQTAFSDEGAYCWMILNPPPRRSDLSSLA